MYRWPGLWLLLAAGGAAAGDCSLDVARMQRGERRPALLCGPGIAADARFVGLERSGIVVEYRQHLRRCSVEQSDPGFYLWLRAQADAAPATLEVKAPDGSGYCGPLAIDVPARRLLAPAALRAAPRHGAGVYRLDVRDAALADACAAGIGFPREPWMPELSVLEGTAVDCHRNGARALVRLGGAQRFPAAVTFGNDAIAWVDTPAPAWARDMQPEEAKFIDVGGVRTRYLEAGRGEDAVILVHGGQPDPISPTAESWRANFRGLAREFRVIAYDVLGSGYTDGPAGEAGYGDFYPQVADHLFGLIRALGLQRVHLVGSSQGGWPVLRVALDHPEVVRCAVSVDTVMAPFTRDAGGLRVFAYLLSHVHPPSGPTPESLMRGEKLLWHTWNNLDPDEALTRMEFAKLPKLARSRDAMARARMSPGHPAFRALREQALAELAAGRLRVPHLVIWGYDDPVASFAQGAEFYRAAAASSAPTQFTVLGAAGHIPQTEYPEAFNAAVIGFCGRYRER